MVWFLVDDVLPFHERVLRAGNAAMGLWVRCGAWCSGQLTDGFVPIDVARTMGAAGEIRKLLAVGLWTSEVVDDVPGYRFHAWGEDGTGQKRQPTRAEVEERRRKEREKKRRQRAAAERDDEGRFASPGIDVVSPRDTLGESRRESLRTRPGQAIPPLLAALEGGAPHVDNPGEDAEPPLRCADHVGEARPPRCGGCKDTRLVHEQWEIRHLAAQKRASARPRAWDPATHCEHGQLLGRCETCEYEASRASSTVIRGPWGAA